MNHMIENGKIRNYLADRLRAQRAIKSRTYDEETIKDAEEGLRNMIRSAADNAPWYTPHTEVAELFDEDYYAQTMFNQVEKHFDVRGIADQYREYYKGRDTGLMESVENLYMDVGKEILSRIADLATVSERNTYMNKKILAQLEYVTDELDIGNIQTMYRESVENLVVRPDDEKYKPMIKGILQEYFKNILLDRSEDVIIDKYFEDTDYTKELEENREEFVEDLDKFTEEHSEDEKMLQVRSKGKITFASIKQAIDKLLRRDEHNR